MTRNGCRYLALPLIGMVAACGGNDPGPVTASNCGVVSGSCSAPVTPTPAPGSAPAPTPSALFEATEITSYKGIGGSQQISENFAGGELYTAEQSKPDTQQVQIGFNPRDAVFTFKVTHEEAEADLRYQDPLHRTDFNPRRHPQTATPDLPLFSYLESAVVTDDLRDVRTFFYRQPGSGTRYVTLAGFTRNMIGELPDNFNLKRVRGAYAFGSQTSAGNVPTRGTGSYSGAMLATMVRNIEAEQNPAIRSRFEWIHGEAKVDVDFGTGAVRTSFNGTVQPTAEEFSDFGAYNQPIPGATFTASGSGSIDGSRLNYVGTIGQATLGSDLVSIAASSLDGTFYGPDAVETGGAFRIVGSTPDQRVDIIGGFVGAKAAQ